MFVRPLRYSAVITIGSKKNADRNRLGRLACAMSSAAPPSECPKTSICSTPRRSIAASTSSPMPGPREVTALGLRRVTVTPEVERVDVERLRQCRSHGLVGAAADPRRVRDQERRAVTAEVMDRDSDVVGRPRGSGSPTSRGTVGAPTRAQRPANDMRSCRTVDRVDLAQNAERFSGFADLYDRVRPTPPTLLADIVCTYAGTRRPDVVDLGSGSGLSTRWIATLGFPRDRRRAERRHARWSRSARTMHRRSRSSTDGRTTPGCPTTARTSSSSARRSTGWSRPPRSRKWPGCCDRVVSRGDGLRLAAIGRQRSGRGGVAGVPRPGEGVRRTARSGCSWRLADGAPPFAASLPLPPGFARDAPRGAHDERRRARMVEGRASRSHGRQRRVLVVSRGRRLAHRVGRR